MIPFADSYRVVTLRPSEQYVNAMECSYIIPELGCEYGTLICSNAIRDADVDSDPGVEEGISYVLCR